MRIKSSFFGGYAFVKSADIVSYKEQFQSNRIISYLTVKPYISCQLAKSSTLFSSPDKKDIFKGNKTLNAFLFPVSILVSTYYVGFTDEQLIKQS